MAGRRHRIKIAVAIICALSGYFFYAYHDFFMYNISRIFHTEISTMEDELIHILEENPDQVFDALHTKLQEHPQTSAVCHGIAHKLGHHAYELYGFDRAMQYQNSLCGAGYIHGVIESHFGLFSKELLTEDITTICTPTDEQCNHGIGHGVMIYTKNNIEESLRMCDLLSLPGRSDCYDGVFMHVFDNEETGVSKDIPERTLGAQLCEKVTRQQMTSCYFYVPRIFTRDVEIGQKTGALCSEIKNVQLAKASEICAYGAGVAFEKYMPSHDEAVGLCATYFTDRLQQECRAGIASYANWSESRFTE
jgi:hypothetical protein